jgi:hypothetical protein
MRIIHFFSLICIQAIFAQTFDKFNQSRKFERQAVADYHAKDFASFLENRQKASDFRPNHFRLLYNLAAGFALNEKPN